MKWTKEKPVEQGYYWIYRPHYISIHCVWMPRPRYMPLDIRDAYWQGPLEVPEPPEVQ